jgi:phosphatidylglycerophosphate synthase
MVGKDGVRNASTPPEKDEPMESRQEIEISETSEAEGFRDWITFPMPWWYMILVVPVMWLLMPLLRKRPWILPNHITLLSFIAACAACGLILLGKPWSFLAAGLLVYVSYALDCIDGMVARMNKATSEWGAFLDIFFDRWKILLYTLGLIWVSLSLHGDILTGMLAAANMGLSGANIFMSAALPNIIGGPRWSASLASGATGGAGRLGRWMAFADRIGIRPTAGDIEADALAYCIGPISIYFFGWDHLKIFLAISITLHLVPLQMGHFYFAWRNLRRPVEPEMDSVPKE